MPMEKGGVNSRYTMSVQSISKSVTWGIMRLAVKGLIDLDDPV